MISFLHSLSLAQSTGAAEYAKCNKCPGYDIKQSDGEAPVMLELWGCEVLLHGQSDPEW